MIYCFKEYTSQEGRTNEREYKSYYIILVACLGHERSKFHFITDFILQALSLLERDINGAISKLTTVKP